MGDCAPFCCCVGSWCCLIGYIIRRGIKEERQNADKKMAQLRALYLTTPNPNFPQNLTISYSNDHKILAVYELKQY